MEFIDILNEQQLDEIFRLVQAKRQRERRAAQGEEGRKQRREYAREWRRRQKQSRDIN